MGCNSICAPSTGRVVGLVCSHTQLFLFQKHLQYRLIDRAMITIAVTGVLMVENVFLFIEDQKV